ncbi:MAG: hypothetical protein JO211_16845, partial [Acidobacteriaceae bacterium]|nr:hypothetical protein [Acidobacteriaceae bacterium]
MRYFLGVTAIVLACSLGLAQQAPPQATAPAPATAPLAGQAPAAAPTSQAAAAPAAKPRPAPKNNFLLQNVRLIDGRGGPARDHVSILIKNGKIAQIVSGSAITLNDPDVEKLDLKGKTVMPGLINGHGHLGLTRAGRFSTAAFAEDTISSQLFHYQQYGVTTMISLGLNKDLLYQLRARQEKGEYGGTTILTADRGIGVPNGVPQIPVAEDQIYR